MWNKCTRIRTVSLQFVIAFSLPFFFLFINDTSARWSKKKLRHQLLWIIVKQRCRRHSASSAVSTSTIVPSQVIHNNSFRKKKKKTIFSFYCFIFYPQVNRRVCLIVVVCCSPLLLIPKKNFNTSQRLTKHPISVAHLYLELMTSPSLNHYKMFRFNLFFFPVFHLQF